MPDEFEIINNPSIAYLNLFIVDVTYRRPHFHKYIEICLILDGEIQVTSREGVNLYTSGQIFIFSADQVHELQSSKGGSAQVFSLQVSHKFCEPYFPLLKNIVFSKTNISAAVSADAGSALASLLLEIGESYFNRHPGYELLCAGKINLLFYQLLHLISYRRMSEKEEASQLKRAKRINRILEYVDDNFSEKLLLSEIARKEGLSLSYLSHFFKENLHVTFEQYLNTLRFEKAKLLLMQTDMNILEVCLESGFADSRYLNKLFQKKMHCTIKEFRKNSDAVMPAERAKRDGNYQNFYTDEESAQLIRKLYSRPRN